MEKHAPLLIIFGGLPGAGKTTLAKEISRALGATYVRIDTIEQALLGSSLNITQVAEAGYSIGYAVARENLLLGRTVVADSVNPIEITRAAWLAIARDCGSVGVEVEVICSDRAEHQKRVETRAADIPGHTQPTWQEVTSRDYQPWERAHITIDTANKSIEQARQELLGQLPNFQV